MSGSDNSTNPFVVHSKDMEEDNISKLMNITCPLPAISKSDSTDYGMAVDSDYKFEPQDQMFKTMISQTARNALASQDPCTIPDDLREELMRQKRKDDAYKTALCDSYRRNQMCTYADQCRFAHGVQELRLPQHPRGRNHPKYKTVLCDKFSTTGTCKYGTRCQFIHKVVNSDILAQASGMGNNTLLNQTMFATPSANGVSQNTQHMLSQSLIMDMNQSLPYRRTDINRAFARALGDNSNESLMRMTRVCENINRNFPMPEF